VETTSVLSHIINNNCTFDGSNIIYLAGTSIVFVSLLSFSITFSRILNILDLD